MNHKIRIHYTNQGINLLTKLKLNSVALVREWTIPTKRPPLVGEVVPTFADRGCRVISATDFHRSWSRFSWPEPLLFLPSSSSVVLTRLSGPCSRPAPSQKILKRRESNPGPLDLTTRPTEAVGITLLTAIIFRKVSDAVGKRTS
jgi:hypothetical protein